MGWGTRVAPGLRAEAVFRSVQIDGLAYGYFYDALGRRRAKLHPLGARDEYFHGVDGRLLVDQGWDSELATGYRTVDDYVWLGGRPVLLLRGRLDKQLEHRLPDTTWQCGRNGEQAGVECAFPSPTVLPDLC